MFIANYELWAVMPRPAFDNPVTFTAGRLDIDGHVHTGKKRVKSIFDFIDD